MRAFSLYHSDLVHNSYHFLLNIKSLALTSPSKVVIDPAAPHICQVKTAFRLAGFLEGPLYFIKAF